MNKKGMATFLIVAIVLGAVIGGVYLISVISEGENQLSGDGIDVGLYDNDGNPIGTNTLSIVNGVSGVGYIDLSISATNTGSLPLSCSILSGSIQPTAFDIGLTDRGTKTASLNQKIGWTSGLIAVGPFEGSTTTFRATVRCSYVLNGATQYMDKNASVGITVSSEGSAGFNVDVTPGGISSCGNGICEPSNGEDSTTCLQDCPSTTKVKFRTTDLSYVSGSAVAFTESCGSNLVPYGYTGAGSSSVSTCSLALSGSGYIQKITGLPGGWQTGYNAPSLWLAGSNVRICQEKSGGTYIYYKTYNNADSDKDSISILPTATGTKEVNC